MATKKQTRRGTKAPSAGKRAASTSRRSTVLLSRISREVVGGVLLVVGLFLTAAFLSGRGALLGETGMAGVTHLMGLAGLLLPPACAVVGIALLVGYLPYRRISGAGILLVAGAGTLAASLPQGRQFDAALYPEHGGLLGSVLHAAVYWIGGVVGVVLVLGVLYAVGLSLLTGVALGSALWSVREGVGGVAAGVIRRYAGWKAARSGTNKRVSREGARRSPRRNGPEPEQRVPHGATGAAVQGVEPEDGDTREFEIVLPESGRHEKLEEVGEPVYGDYVPPSMSLLDTGSEDPEHDAEGTSQRLTQALEELGVKAHVVRAIVGPRVTRYELRLGSGVKVGKVRNLQQDIAYALAATEVRMLAPIPGKSAVGVEVPNTRPATVTLGDVFGDYPTGSDWALPVGLGKDISGRAVFMDLAEMPHLLVAGTTGSGKSVMLNGLLTSLILTTDPRQVKMVLIDPKRVELSQFGRIPHLITPVVTDVKKAANALTWAVAEMERRYELLEDFGTRSIDGYNERNESPLPYVVVVIDELADLMMTAAAKVEDAVIRLAQKARAVGIHLVVATQRPSVDVITGMIKANIPSRIAFAVSSQVDSRVILDNPGAEALLGSGDMLFKPVSALRPSRVQGAYLSEKEVDRVVTASTENAEARYIEEVTESRPERAQQQEPEDDLLPDAAGFVVSSQQASVSAVQRRFRVGYSRAGRIIDALERKGVVGPYEGSKSRSIVATEMDLGQIFSSAEEADAPAAARAPGGDPEQEPDLQPGMFPGENGPPGR